MTDLRPSRCEIGCEKPSRNGYRCHGQLVKVCGFWVCKFHKALAELICVEALGDDVKRQKVAA